MEEIWKLTAKFEKNKDLSSKKALLLHFKKPRLKYMRSYTLIGTSSDSIVSATTTGRFK